MLVALLQSLRVLTPSLVFLPLDLCHRLWFELTEALYKFVSDEQNSRQQNFVEVRQPTCHLRVPTGEHGTCVTIACKESDAAC